MHREKGKYVSNLNLEYIWNTMKNTEHFFTESLYCWCYEAQLSEDGDCSPGMLGERWVQLTAV